MFGCEEGWQEDNQFRDLMGEEVGSFITAELKDVSRPPLVDTYIAQHYKSLADWEAFKQLNAAVGNEELTRLKEKAEPHTLLLFENEEIGNV